MWKDTGLKMNEWDKFNLISNNFRLFNDSHTEGILDESTFNSLASTGESSDIITYKELLKRFTELENNFYCLQSEYNRTISILQNTISSLTDEIVDLMDHNSKIEEVINLIVDNYLIGYE